MKNFAPKEKLAIVLSLVAGEATAAELCQKFGIKSAKTIYNWRSRLLESADLIFRERRGSPHRLIAKLPPPDAPRDGGYLAPESAKEFAADNDEEDEKALQDLFGIDERELARMVAGKPKMRGESQRGRSSLARKIAANLRKKGENRGGSQVEDVEQA